MWVICASPRPSRYSPAWRAKGPGSVSTTRSSPRSATTGCRCAVPRSRAARCRRPTWSCCSQPTPLTTSRRACRTHGCCSPPATPRTADAGSRSGRCERGVVRRIRRHREGRSAVTGAVGDLLVAAAAGGLPGSLREFPELPLPVPEALDVVREAELLGIAGLMFAAVTSGGLALPPVAVEALDEARLHESTTRLYLEQELVSVSGLLDEA